MPEQGYDWANKFDHYIYDHIIGHNHNGILNYTQLGSIAHLAVPTQDHFYRCLLHLELRMKLTKLKYFNHQELGSLSMTSYLLGV